VGQKRKRTQKERKLRVREAASNLFQHGHRERE